jgi:hypothetical protein
MFAVSRRSGSRHTRNVHRVPQALGEPQIWLTAKLMTQADGRDGQAVNMRRFCAVSQVRLLTAKSNLCRVCCVCREPSQSAHGICTWRRVCCVCREPLWKLTANRPVCCEPDVRLTALLDVWLTALLVNISRQFNSLVHT